MVDSVSDAGAISHKGIILDIVKEQVILVLICVNTANLKGRIAYMSKSAGQGGLLAGPISDVLAIVNQKGGI